MKKVLHISMVSVALTFSLSSTVNAKGQFQPVYSFKNLGEFTSPDGKEFTKILVTCKGDPKPRFIQRTVGQKLWCLDGQPDTCSKERIDPATTACTNSAETFIVAAPEEAEPPVVSAADLEKARLRQQLLTDQMKVEQQRLEIEARRIELREKEIEIIATRDGS